jgi:hypothetical protein
MNMVIKGKIMSIGHLEYLRGKHEARQEASGECIIVGILGFCIGGILMFIACNSGFLI